MLLLLLSVGGLLDAVICWLSYMLWFYVPCASQINYWVGLFLKKSSLSQYSLKWISLICELWYSKDTVVLSVHPHTHRVWNTLTWNTQPYCICLHCLRTMWISTHTHTHTQARLTWCFFKLILFYVSARWKLLHHFRVRNVGSTQKFDLAVFKTWLICYRYIKEKS